MSLLPSANSCCDPCNSSSATTVTLAELIATVTPVAVTGIGSPEGVTTAVVGSFYTDITDPDHPILYQKTTGSGNTGWVLFVAI